jgi:RNA polymerase sigma-70 factor (ECF subfamily)
MQVRAPCRIRECVPVICNGVKCVDDLTQQSDGLAHRLKCGDLEALADLFSREHERLWRMVGFRIDRRLFGRVDPDDVLQDAYLAATGRLKHYADDSSLSPFVWVRMILMQTLTDIHRHHLGAQMRDADRELALNARRTSMTTSVSLAAVLVGRLTSPSQAAVRAELFERVEQAIATMDPIDQEVLALRHFEELSNSEVAEVLGIGQKAASIRYVRALKRLKSIVSEMPGLFDGD